MKREKSEAVRMVVEMNTEENKGRKRLKKGDWMDCQYVACEDDVKNCTKQRFRT